MCYRYLHIFLRPAERAEETFDPQLANGLQAEPFRTDFAGIGMLQRVNVYAAAGLCLTLPDGVRNGSGEIVRRKTPLLTKIFLILIYD